MRRSNRRGSPVNEQDASDQKLITFGQPASQCSLHDRPAIFAQCMDCDYRRGARGLGILCGHRFGVDPTYITGRLTQIQGDQIIPLEGEL